MRIQLLLTGAGLLAAALAWRLVEDTWPGNWTSLAVFAGSRAVAAHIFRLDRLRWRDWGRDDNLIWNLAVAGGTLIAMLSAATWEIEAPMAVTVVDALLYLQIGLWPTSRALELDAPAGRRKPALIYGAGAQGRLLLEELRRPGGRFEPIGWIDDDPDKEEAVLAGLPVLGPVRSLPFLSELHGVETVFTAIPCLTTECFELATEMAEMAHVRLCVLPTVRDALAALDRERMPA